MRTAPAQNVYTECACVCVWSTCWQDGEQRNRKCWNGPCCHCCFCFVAAAAKGRRRKLLRKGQLNCIKFNNFCTKRSEPNQVEQLRNVCRPAAATRKHIKAAKGFRPADYVQNRHGGQKHVRTQHIVRPTTRSDNNNNNNSNTRSNNNWTTYVCKGLA